MIRHLPAILFIIGTLAVYAFYVMFAVAGVVLAINYVLLGLGSVPRRRTSNKTRRNLATPAPRPPFKGRN
jgi:hypothetical protein